MSGIIRPEVIQTIVAPKGWHYLAIQKMANFFEQNGQLREVYKANGQYHLVVAFRDEIQAAAFAKALNQGEFKN